MRSEPRRLRQLRRPQAETTLVAGRDPRMRVPARQPPLVTALPAVGLGRRRSRGRSSQAEESFGDDSHIRERCVACQPDCRIIEQRHRGAELIAGLGHLPLLIEIAAALVGLLDHSASHARPDLLQHGGKARRQVWRHRRGRRGQDHLLDRSFGIGGAVECDQTQRTIQSRRLLVLQRRDLRRGERVEGLECLLVLGRLIQRLRIDERDIRRAKML